MSSTHKHGRQEWPIIWGMGFASFFCAWIALAYWGWNYHNSFAPVSSFVEFLHPVITAMREYVLQGKTDSLVISLQYAINNDQLPDVLLHIALPALPAAFAGYFMAKAIYIEGGLDGFIHISGPRLLVGKTAIRHAKAQFKNNKSKKGLQLHPDIYLPKHEENGNILVVGNHGTGKSALLTPLFNQVIERQQPAFIFDYKSEFTALFYHLDKTLLVSVTDARNTPWNIAADVTTEQRANKIASQLIPEMGKDPIWEKGSQLILTGMMMTLINQDRPWGWQELASLLTIEVDQLKDILGEHFPLAKDFVQNQESKTTQSFMVTLKTHLGWIIPLAQAWPKAHENGFSVMDWVQNSSQQKPILIVQHSEEFSTIAAPLANAMIQLMYTGLRSLHNDTEREIWLLIDELGHLPRCSTLESWLSTGRSYGARTIIGTQTLSKVLDIYGENLTHSIFDLFEILLVLRLSGSTTADYIVRRFGERKVKPRQSSSEATNTGEQTLPLITTSDLIHLPKPRAFHKRPIHAFMLLQGWQAVYKLTFPFAKLQPQAQEHIPAAWLSQPPAMLTPTLAEPEATPQAVINPLAVLGAAHVDHSPD
ncbi:MAG: type IV secretion system DNA-binding domain-containing protein [Candidatus Thiodiazotropha sp. 4PDIV1]